MSGLEAVSFCVKTTKVTWWKWLILNYWTSGCCPDCTVFYDWDNFFLIPKRQITSHHFFLLCKSEAKLSRIRALPVDAGGIIQRRGCRATATAHCHSAARYGTLILAFPLPWNQTVSDGSVPISVAFSPGVPSTQIGTFTKEPTTLQTSDWLSRIIAT